MGFGDGLLRTGFFGFGLGFGFGFTVGFVESVAEALAVGLTVGLVVGLDDALAVAVGEGVAFFVAASALLEVERSAIARMRANFFTVAPT